MQAFESKPIACHQKFLHNVRSTSDLYPKNKKQQKRDKIVKMKLKFDRIVNQLYQIKSDQQAEMFSLNKLKEKSQQFEELVNKKIDQCLNVLREEKCQELFCSNKKKEAQLTLLSNEMILVNPQEIEKLNFSNFEKSDPKMSCWSDRSTQAAETKRTNFYEYQAEVVKKSLKANEEILLRKSKKVSQRERIKQVKKILNERIDERQSIKPYIMSFYVAIVLLLLISQL